MRRVKIDVAVRIRPTNEQAKALHYTNRNLTVRGTKHYAFSNVLTPECTQVEVFEQCKLGSVIDHMLEGYNSTVLAFGQTGAGKTYTMEGIDDKRSKSIDSPGGNELQGMIPRSIRAMFDKLHSKGLNNFRVSCSFLQIYNEKIYDLFSTNVTSASPFMPANRQLTATLKMGLKMRWDRDNEFSVESLECRMCTDQEEMLKAWSDGLKNRVVAATRLNLSSSRSHTIFTIRLHQTPQSDGVFSKLEFVDLAGSERIISDGRLVKQSIDINKSLFALRKVINSLESKQAFVPYRQSKLTSLLKQSFGGNNYCLFMACINPADSCVEQSIVTLDYTTKASTIQNRVEKRSDKRDIVIEELKRENETLRVQLNSCYRQIEILNKINSQSSKTQSNRKQTSPSIHSPLANQQSDKDFLKLKQISIPLLHKEDTSPTQFADRSNFSRYKEQVRIDYEYFGERLVESINTVRQLLKSNKKLREELDLERNKCEQYAYEFEQLMNENDKLRNGHQLPPSLKHEDSLDRQFGDKHKLHQPTQRAKSHRRSTTFKSRNIRLNTDFSRNDTFT